MGHGVAGAARQNRLGNTRSQQAIGDFHLGAVATVSGYKVHSFGSRLRGLAAPRRQTCGSDYCPKSRRQGGTHH